MHVRHMQSSRLHQGCLVTQAKPKLTAPGLYLQLAFSRQLCPAAQAPWPELDSSKAPPTAAVLQGPQSLLPTTYSPEWGC